MWSGTALDGAAATIDMLTITLPGTKTATSIAVNDTNGFGALVINLAGLTIDPQNPQPTPQPQPQCTRPGNSCSTPAADNSQAWKFQPSVPGAAAPTNPHPNANSSNHGHKSQ